MVELIAVLTIAAVLAAVALPRLSATAQSRGNSWRAQVHAALRQAQVVAHGHRRLVCVSIGSTEVRLTIAAANPASSCTLTLAGPDGDSRWAWDERAPSTSATPATLYFQPDGRVTSDGAGASAVNASITISGETALNLTGETGHVD